MDLDRARAVDDVARVIVDSAKVDIDFLKVTGQSSAGFLDSQEDDQSQAGLPPGITGIRWHVLK